MSKPIYVTEWPTHKAKARRRRKQRNQTIIVPTRKEPHGVTQ